jgi:hypothetical protein
MEAAEVTFSRPKIFKMIFTTMNDDNFTAGNEHGQNGIETVT